MISLIVAMDRNRNIGLNGDMPWGNTMKADLRRFKELTDGKWIIMGRKTFESLPFVLPNRQHVVITSEYKRDISKRPVFYVQDVAEAWDFTKYFHQPYWGKEHEQEVFVIGGASVYQQFLDMGDVGKIYVTKVLANLEGDTKFPEITGKWDIAQGGLFHHPDDKYGSQYITYTRR
jgi:dihydrofolate reductase